MHKLIYLQKAVDDLEDIYAYISMGSVQIANNMVERILDKADQLSEFPMMGPPVDKPGIHKDYRMLVVSPYIIFYRIIDEKIYIYRVLHEKRYYNSLL